MFIRRKFNFAKRDILQIIIGIHYFLNFKEISTTNATWLNRRLNYFKNTIMYNFHKSNIINFKWFGDKLEPCLNDFLVIIGKTNK